MKKLIVVIVVLGAAMLACEAGAAVPTPVPTVNPFDYGMTLVAAEVNADATKDAVGLHYTATAQVYGATATQAAIAAYATSTQQARIDAEATSAMERANAIATQQRLDREATQEQAKRDQQTTATHEAFMAHQTMTQQAFQVTGTAQVIGTQTAYPQTERASQATEAMAAAYGVAQSTAVYAGAESVVLAVERERVTNMIRAWVPWMGFVGVLGVLSIVALRVSRTRVVQKDAFGAMPGLVIDGAAFDLDAGMSARVLTDGSVEFKQHDDKVTSREQYVKGIRALPAGRQDVPQLEFGRERKEPVIEVIEPSAMSRQILDEIQDQVVEEE